MSTGRQILVRFGALFAWLGAYWAGEHAIGAWKIALSSDPDVSTNLLDLVGSTSAALISAGACGWLLVLAVRASPAFTWFALLLGVPATILLLIQAVSQDDALLPYSSAIEAVLYFYAAYALISYMLEDHVITRDELYEKWNDCASLVLPPHGVDQVFELVDGLERVADITTLVRALTAPAEQR